MEDKWTTVIDANNGKMNFNIKELLMYKDLIFLLIKKDYTTRYKQTILGPLWLILTPLLTTVIFSVVFGNIAGLSTDGVPQPLFYLAGNIIWTLLSSCVTKISSTFVDNVSVFGKVYFPRLAVPIATMSTAMLDFLIQFVLFVVIYGVYAVFGLHITLSSAIFLAPLLVLETGLLGMGVGIIMAAMTIKYRDLGMIISFLLQLWMYATPIVYSIGTIPSKWLGIYMLNPMSPIVVTFRNIFLGTGGVPWRYLGFSGVITLLLLMIGVAVFNKVQKTFVDMI